MSDLVASNVTQSIMALSKIKGVGKKALNYLARDKAFCTAPPEEWGSYVQEFSVLSDIERKGLINSALSDIDVCLKLGVRVFSAADLEYPDSFRSLPDAPALIYCKGDFGLLKRRCLAIIGTREPTALGVESAKRITAWFSGRDWVIVSGLAVGIDSTAHRQCVDSGGKTIAVLAHGLEKVYPAENKGLASDILDSGGLLVSEYAPYSRVFKSSFVDRDRLQAGLSSGTVLVQTGVQGGSLYASRASLLYGRSLIVVAPLASDILAGPEKIQGNLKILESKSQDEVAQYLKCPAYMTKNISFLRSKDDYELLESKLNSISEGLSPRFN